LAADFVTDLTDGLVVGDGALLDLLMKAIASEILGLMAWFPQTALDCDSQGCGFPQ
jgi:hypothetical protein